MSYAATPPHQPQPRPLPPMPGMSQRIRKVGAPIGVIIALGLVAGLLVMGVTATNPVGAALGLVLSSVGIGFVVLCYLWLDRWEPEASRLLVLAFVWGASFAVVVSAILELAFGPTLKEAGPEGMFSAVAIRAPFIEEAAKGLFLLIMCTGRRRREVNSLTDCLVYAGITAAGFAWLEDIVYIASGGSIAGSLVVAVLRLGAGPFAHPLFTTMTGIGVYFALRQRGAAAKFFCVLAGYLVAVIMHGLWNGSSLLGAEAYIGVYLLWMLPIFVTMIIVAVRSRRHEQRAVAAKLPGMVQAGLVSENEASWLGSFRGRKQAIGEARRLGGPAAAKSVKNFALQVVELAFVRDRIEAGCTDPRVYAMQTEEAYAVMAARAAAPTLGYMAGYRASPRLHTR